jgi:hypothetical protein
MTGQGLKAEVAARLAAGKRRITMAVLLRRLAALGYAADRTNDCRAPSCWITGPRAGSSYPALTLYIVERDSGLSFCNVGARRDANFTRLQEMRLNGDSFALSRGALVEL